LLETPLEAGQAIRRAMELGEQCALDTIDDSGLRGCGGAGFKTGVKWSMCRDADGPDRVVVCNADEGEPGTFKDRLLLQHYADRLFEGMTVCSYTVGATRGFVYLRAEYRYMMADLQQILQRRREQNLLGENILGHRGFDFDIQIHLGAGAYICGEESALIESLEGKRGIPRNRPPFPTTSGYLHRPTVVNNVETLVLSAMIMAYGSSWFTASGTDSSPGTKLLSISGDCERPGIYEYPFGVSVQQVLDECGADKTQAVQIGGPSGSLIGQEAFNRRLSFDDLATGGSFMIFNQSRNLLDVIHNFTAFFEHESCGFCTPCRVGTTLLNKQLSKIMVGRATARDLEYIKTIGNLMKQSSHCGLGATAANPLLDSIQRFPLIYKSYLRSTGFEPSFDVDASLEEARQASGRNDPGAHLAGGGV
jgi:[NiFe] hydrogenase diaphorase moiety large subunit